MASDSPVYRGPRVKICGITTIEDGLAAARLGIDYLGFVFFPPSPRYVEPEQAGRIVRAIREEMGDAAPCMMGVYVNLEPEAVADIRKTAGLDGSQICGNEPPEWMARIEPERFRAVSIETLDRIGSYDCEAYICDAHDPKRYGGTGKAYDYAVLAPFIPKHRIMLAGGLTADTVGAVVAELKPWGVDVSSALEASPGRKDTARMAAFVESVRCVAEK
ncbi:MAG: phosphoribosylanthranilate isomerase [Candidatus Sumerlaeota bacterium]